MDGKTREKTRAGRSAIVLVAVTVTVAGCNVCGIQLPPGAEASPTPQVNARVDVVPSGKAADKRFTTIETVPEPNCAGSSQVSQTIQRTISYTHAVELGKQVSVNANGTALIPGIGQVQVGGEISRHYNVTYGSEESVTESLTVSADAGTNMQHSVRYYELWETGTVKVTSEGKEFDAPYRLLRSKGVELQSSERVPCSSVTTPPLPAPVLLTPMDGSRFSNYPRTTTLTWRAVTGAQSYRVEIDYCDPTGCDVSATRLRLDSVTTTSDTFTFVGKQPGRWRVWAVLTSGIEGSKSDWWQFVYAV